MEFKMPRLPKQNYRWLEAYSNGFREGLGLEPIYDKNEAPFEGDYQHGLKCGKESLINHPPCPTYGKNT
jgi:hypothetical protein